MIGFALNFAKRLARSVMFAGMFVMFLPFGVLVAIGKAWQLLAPVKDAI